MDTVPHPQDLEQASALGADLFQHSIENHNLDSAYRALRIIARSLTSPPTAPQPASPPPHRDTTPSHPKTPTNTTIITTPNATHPGAGGGGAHGHGGGHGHGHTPAGLTVDATSGSPSSSHGVSHESPSTVSHGLVHNGTSK